MYLDLAYIRSLLSVGACSITHQSSYKFTIVSKISDSICCVATVHLCCAYRRVDVFVHFQILLVILQNFSTLFPFNNVVAEQRYRPFAIDGIFYYSWQMFLAGQILNDTIECCVDLTILARFPFFNILNLTIGVVWDVL